MGDKKRKGLELSSEPPTKKKNKKFATKDAGDTVKTTVTSAPPTTVAAIQNGEFSTKKDRKRAADFMSDDEDQIGANPASGSALADDADPPKKEKKKKRKKSKKGLEGGESLIADGANGVAEDVSAGKKSSNSMQAEAQRTVDREMEEEFAPATEGGAELDEDDGDSNDDGAALLAGFDSDNPDEAEDELPLAGDKRLKPPHLEKSLKKIRKAKKANESEAKPGTVYVGRIPHGFYELQMRAYFSQFGDITRLRLSRNRHTGASKHFAFIEFTSVEVAKIVAATMDNYLMFGHILKCKFAPDESLHPDVWKGANKRFRKIPHDKLERQKLAEPKSVEQWRKKIEKEKNKREKKAKQLKQMLGYDMPETRLVDPAAVLEQKQVTNGDNAGEIEDEVLKDVMQLEADKAESNGEDDGTKIASDSDVSDTSDASGGSDDEADEAGVALDKGADAKTKEGKKPKDQPLTPQQLKKARKLKKKERQLSMKLYKKQKRAAIKQENHRKHMLALSESNKKKAAAAKAAGLDPATLDLSKMKLTREQKLEARKSGPNRDENGKYVPPVQRKQMTKVKFARDNPEEHNAQKKQKMSALKQARAEKKEKRKQRLQEKYGKKNFKSGEKKVR